MPRPPRRREWPSEQWRDGGIGWGVESATHEGVGIQTEDWHHDPCGIVDSRRGSPWTGTHWITG